MRDNRSFDFGCFELILGRYKVTNHLNHDKGFTLMNPFLFYYLAIDVSYQF